MKTNRNKWLMATASSSTHLGDVIFEYAIKWWIASISTSATFLAVVLSIETLVSSLFNMIGGVFADRYDRRKLLIGTDIISGIGALALYFFCGRIIGAGSIIDCKYDACRHVFNLCTNFKSHRRPIV